MSSTKSNLVSGEQLARWLGVSRKEIYDLGKIGILMRVGRTYRLEESVPRYCEHLRQTLAGKRAAPTSSADGREALGPRPAGNQG
jgi:biotin operon repressor